MKIVEFDSKGRRVDLDAEALRRDRHGKAPGSALAPPPKSALRSAPAPAAPPAARRKSSGVELHMFQTGTLRTKLKYIKMNQGEEDFEIPVPWFLIRHPKGNVVIDGVHSSAQ